MGTASRRSWLRRCRFVGLVVLALAGWARWLSGDPRVVLLGRAPSGARWVRIDRPFDLASHKDARSAVSFAARVDCPAATSFLFDDVLAIGTGILSVDGRPLAADAAYGPGRHVVRFDVVNDNGPALALITGRNPELRTGVADWRASDDGGRTWARAVPADAPWEPAVPAEVGSTSRELLRLSPGLAIVFAVGAWPMLWRRRPAGDWGWRARWVVLVAWVALAANDGPKLSMGIGYDVDSHYQYVHYVAEHAGLPPADGGWQFFQAPLYYIVSGTLERALRWAGMAATAVPYALRVVPLACGVALAELCYRSARIAFPGRGDLQAVATVVGGLLPANLYMAQTVSNEPMAAATAGLVVWATLALLADPAGVRSVRRLAWLGAALGVAWLTKVSGLVWAVPVAGAMAVAVARVRAGEGATATGETPVRRRGLGADVARLAIVPAVALVVSGWYFARNLVQVGRPFFRESSVAASRWWQDPGYRTPGNLYAFGHVLARPVYNGLGSVWDSLYGTLWGNGIPSGQPRWNYGLMGAGLWLALLPTALIVAGTASAVGRGRWAARFAAASVGLFVLAIVNVYLTLPIYSSAKASYMLGTAPCLGILAAAGFDLLRGRRWATATATGGLACWAVAAYLAYFVV